MGGLLAVIIAIIVGVVLGVGGAFGLVASQGGNGYPPQNPGSITVYGTS